MPLDRLVLLLLPLLLTGCAQIIGSQTRAMAENLRSAMLDHDDPRTVAEAMPAYLVMVDSLIAGRPDDAGLLRTGSRLYGAYAGTFIEAPERRRRLARRAFDYARQAFCLELPEPCRSLDAPHPRFTAAVDTVGRAHVPALHALGTAWAGWIQASEGDWRAIADLSKVRHLLQRVVQLDEAYDGGSAHLYLGVIESLVPPAMGGRPERARAHFERALALSDGRNQMARVLYARHYARLVFDRALHDRLLREVLEADPHQPGLTLINMLARDEARRLLDEADEFF